MVLPRIERLLARLTGRRVQLSALLVPSLVLRSTGARSGEIRETELMYTPDGHGRAIVAGTSFARQRHPAWTYNLLAHPDAEILVRGRAMRVRALPVADAAIIGKVAGATLLVFKSAEHPPHEIDETVKRLVAAGVRPRGAIMNQVGARAGSYGYGNYGYSYYKYEK